jgi:nucleoside-diphosphate-sugar epimerase
MKIIVTGASGFIGSALVRSMVSMGHSVIAIVHSEKSDIRQLNKSGAEVIYCNTQEIRSLGEKISGPVDSCVHLAWVGSYGFEKSDYEVQIGNVRDTLELIETLSSMGVKKLVCSGTIAEKEVIRNFGTGSKNLPSNYYAVAKVAAHMMSEILCGKKGIGLNWCYISNAYGPGDRSTNFINSAVTKMLSGERTSFSSGNQLYDFTYIDDVVNAIAGILSDGVPGKTYYVGSSKCRPLKDYIKVIRDSIDPDISLHFGEVPSSDSSLDTQDYDISELSKDTGYEPVVPFEKGILKTIDALKDKLGRMDG